MDMEHQLQQLLHFSPQEQLLLVGSPGFFPIDGAHFPGGTAAAGVDDDDGRWGVENLIMQLGDELFGGGGDVHAIAGAGATGDHHIHPPPWQCDGGGAVINDHQQWQFEDDGGGGSPDGPPPPSMSPDGDGSPPASSAGDQGAGELLACDDASAAATRKRRDRSKTIVSERKRRVRMKEKLYELRALVPNITKMDKASIIADAVVYVKNLQAHARTLRAEVAALEASPAASPAATLHQEQQQNRRGGATAAGRHQQERGASGAAAGARVTRVGAAQVGEGRFFVTVECERRDGVAAPLCAAAESLAGFRVESSSVGRSGPDRVVSTLTLKVSDRVGDAAAIGEATVKVWVMAALLKEGFRPEASTVDIS